MQLRLSRQDPEQRRLAGPVRAGEGQPVTPLDLERHSVEQQRACDLLAEIGADDNGHPLSVGAGSLQPNIRAGLRRAITIGRSRASRIVGNYTIVHVADVKNMAADVGMDPTTSRSGFCARRSGYGTLRSRSSASGAAGGPRAAPSRSPGRGVSPRPGRAQVKLAGEVVDLEPWTAVRVPPETTRAFRASGDQDAVFVAIAAPQAGFDDVEFVQDFWVVNAWGSSSAGLPSCRRSSISLAASVRRSHRRAYRRRARKRQEQAAPGRSKHVDVPCRLHVAGYEPERAVPLASTAALLRALVEVPEHGTALEALLFGAPTGSPLESVRIFEAAHRALRALEPTLLTIDDLHWVDERSLALCHYLVRAAQANEQRLAILAAARPDGGGGLPRFTRRELPAESVVTVELDGLPVSGRRHPRDVARPTGQRCRDADLGARRRLAVLARSPRRSDAGTRTRRSSSPTAPWSGRTRHRFSAPRRHGRPLTVPPRRPRWPNGRRHGSRRPQPSSSPAVSCSIPGTVLRPAHDLVRSTALAELPVQTRRRLHRRLAEWLEENAGEDLTLLRGGRSSTVAPAGSQSRLATRLARSPRRTFSVSPVSSCSRYRRRRRAG